MQQEWTQDRIEKILGKAKHVASMYGFKEEADDIAQFVFIRIMKNPKRTVPKIVIDYLRANYGGYRHKQSKLKYAALRSYESLDDQSCGTDTMKDNIDFERLQTKLNTEERGYVLLRFKWEMTEQEIADIYGVSEGRVSQKLKEIKGKLRKHIRKDTLIVP